MPRQSPASKRRAPKSGEPSRVFVDTSAWIAFFSAADINHAVADGAIRAALSWRVGLITSNLVVAEVHRLLLFRAGIRAAAIALDKLTTSASVHVAYADESNHRAARAWIDKLDDQVISLTDAVSFALMKSLKCRSALSFDHDFWTAGFNPWQP